LWVEHGAFLGAIIHWTSPSDVTTSLDENTHDLNMSPFDSYTAWSETGRVGLLEESFRESLLFGSFEYLSCGCGMPFLSSDPESCRGGIDSG
jgi:hypothetical protein